MDNTNDSECLNKLQRTEERLRECYSINQYFLKMIIETRNILSIPVLSDKEKCNAVRLVVGKYQRIWEGTGSNFDKSCK
jgi:hypothetical protein